ncbi:aspartate aminotransferase family protein [Natrialba sp. SSL1]|uniref:aspartate aminotransferase family protein n=1 Tax=Natrialba sp. SSL1 TaxID=1869245 RepID=UPI0008F8A9D7|nr:aspartate aminotransferase family protein [Natrialba sp. SSL1]OIB59033.1 glutamate-1-semialdehyde 2,1-aminomutase [Natrialba sp. SSL1]
MDLWDEIDASYRERTPTSEQVYDDLYEHVPAGVASTYRAFEPYPMVIDRADGPYLYDVDGNRYIDYDLNNGAGMVGHNHPAVTDALSDQLENGTLFTHPHELLGEAAEAIKDRWDPIDLVRFTNSGTESTMHAIRLARAYSGREKVLKIEGSYHGAHDYVLLSKSVPAHKLGHPKQPTTVIESEGVPEAIADTVEIGPWNDLDAIESILEENATEIGTLIVEPIVMNVGVTQPHGEYLQGLRELCDEYNVVLIFDEVKTGVKVAPGGAAEYYGVEPDLVTMAKSIGGNTPVGAFGGREDIMREIENGAAHYGTYNGNPLVLRAVTTVLNEVLTDDAYDHVDALGDRLATGYEEIMADVGLAGHVEQVNSQGIVVFTDEEITNYRDFDEHVDVEFHENYWFAMLERGVLPHPHHASQQWTISVQHEDEHIDRHLEAFKDVAPMLADRQES